MAEASFAAAQNAYREKDFERAIELCGQLEQEGGGQPGLSNLKALACLGAGDLEAAWLAIEEAAGLDPSEPTIRYNAARICKRLLKMPRAVEHASAACELQPGNRNFLYQLAVVLREAGEHARAVEAMERCLERFPGFAEGWLLKADIHGDLGEAEAVKAALERADREGAPSARARAQLADIAKALPSDREAVVPLEEIRSLKAGSRPWVTATFALARVYRRAGIHEEAFRLVEAANEAMRALRPFDFERHMRRLKQATESAVQFRPAAAGQAPSCRPVFIVGMPRSGTSLCEQVLSAHPGVFGCGELSVMSLLENRLRRAGIDPCRETGEGSPGPELKDRLRADFFAALPEGAPDFPVVVDKQPMNFLRVGMIHCLFPEARFVHCTRHPLDTTLSCYFQDFESVGFSNDLEHIARTLVAQERLMDAWKRALPEHVLTVRYEDMVDDLEGRARALAGFLEIDFDPAMLAPHLNRAPVATASKWQVRAPVYRSSVNAWKNYREHLEKVIALFRAGGVLDEAVS